MPSDLEVGTMLEAAKEKEGRHSWLEAAKLYEQVLTAGRRTGSFAADTYERLGFCFRRASTQIEDFKEFEKLSQMAVEAYKNAAQLFETEGRNVGKALQCNAAAQYASSWAASDPSKKRKILEECRNLGKKSLKAYESAGDKPSYGKMYNDLLLYLLESLYVASDWREMKDIAKDGINYADKAIAVLSKLRDNSELLRAYFTASLQTGYIANISEQKEKREELTQKSLSYSTKALELSEEVDNPYYTAMANWAAASCTLLLLGRVKSAAKYAQEMLSQGTIVRDTYLIGVANYLLAFATNWMILREEDPDKKKEGHREVIRHAEDAIKHLHLVSQNYFIAQTYSFYTESYPALARDVEASSEEKRAVLEKAVEIGRKGLEYATRSGSLDATGATLHALSKALQSSSNLETRRDEKTNLLKESLTHRKEYNNVVKRAFPSNDWIRGVGKNYEGLIRAELAKVETDKKEKMSLLESAISDMEDGILRCDRWIRSRPVPTYIVAAARFEDWFGGVLNTLYTITEDEEVLSKAVEVYDDASKKFKKVSLPSRAAESYWKMARNLGRLAKHQKAAENFESASGMYKASGEALPHLKEFYRDYVLYMQAWAEIERARHHHTRQRYDQAKKHYYKAASLHKSSKSWKYLAPNYLAWAQLEYGEDLSRSEESQEAAQVFQEAAKLFREARRTLQVELDRIENADEEDLVRRLVKASDLRRGYCLGRIALEEAKILDRQGDQIASSEKYASAREAFQRIAKTESEQSRKELQPIIYLCQAWQKMMMAEAVASSTMYEEAAELFKKAKEHTVDQPTSLLALANSSFCKALEAGTKFEATLDTKLYSATSHHLESAANYYLRAGIKTASEYVKATQRLFDAYIYMDTAKRETDPETKARYYIMAEKVLQTSAGSYLKAKHPEKSEQVQRLLDNVREERELATSLSEVLHAPTITSSTASFATPSAREENPVGLERFEHANIQTSLVFPPEEIMVGEGFNLEMQITNVGKEAVLLAKVEEIVPEGFELVGKPDYCSFEQTHLNMKGKLLEPLKTEEVRLVLKPLDKGTFEIRPKIVFADETGHQISSEPKPVVVEVSQVVLPDRVATGYEDLDHLLLGGIPQNYAVILTSPSCDEKDLMINKFLDTGAKKGQPTFYVTIEAIGVRALVERFQSNFYLFICNPQANRMIQTLPNVFKLKGVESLTDINIALTSAFRRLDASSSGARRVCIEIISDVLLQHHAVQTRRWLAALIPDLRSRGFTTLAVMNPKMHSSEEVQAILGLFEGEIGIYEKETEKGSEKFLRIRRLYNQKYLEIELALRKR